MSGHEKPIRLTCSDTTYCFYGGKSIKRSLCRQIFSGRKVEDIIV